MHRVRLGSIAGNWRERGDRRFEDTVEWQAMAEAYMQCKRRVWEGGEGRILSKGRAIPSLPQTQKKQELKLRRLAGAQHTARVPGAVTSQDHVTSLYHFLVSP